MKNLGRSPNTIGMRIRALRAIFNEAIEMKIIKRENCYPFGKRRYQIPAGRNLKKALSKEEIARIYYYNTDVEDIRRARDYWIFCYFGNGMNPKDVAYLTFKDVQEEFIVFTRAKTERSTRSNPKLISVYITKEMKLIIDRLGNKFTGNPDEFIFPIIDKGLNPLERFEQNKMFIRFINDRMKIIASDLGITRKVTTIVTRHSFSTHLKHDGASTEFIQEALGHTDKKTTENYLDSFENEVKKAFAKKLSILSLPNQDSLAKTKA
jgi:integrase